MSRCLQAKPKNKKHMKKRILCIAEYELLPIADDVERVRFWAGAMDRELLPDVIAQMPVVIEQSRYRAQFLQNRCALNLDGLFSVL